ncbi:MAG: bifunctional DNA primase/polymerase [Stellaceae bacterium]
MTPLEAALATGLPCFPCAPNKAPAIPGPGGHKYATADPAELHALWRHHPGPLVGVRTGALSGLSVLDIDAAKHPEAEVWLAAHRDQLPLSRLHQTRSGGLHFIFQHALGVRNSASRLAIGVDTRGEGGFVIWWPAAGCPVLCNAAPAAWPEWLLQKLLARPAAVVPRPATPLDNRRFDGVLRRVKFARETQRNSTLFWAACRLGEAIRKGEIGATVAEAALLRAALHADLPEGETRRTIASGFKTSAT